MCTLIFPKKKKRNITQNPEKSAKQSKEREKIPTPETKQKQKQKAKAYYELNIN